MRAIDTNVLVRLIARDEPRQAAAADAFVSRGAWISHLALLEATRVLSSVFELEANQIATAVEMLLDHEHLTVQDAGTVAAALDRFREQRTVSFSDCLLLEVARKAGHLPLGTFDRGLGKLKGAERL